MLLVIGTRRNRGLEEKQDYSRAQEQLCKAWKIENVVFRLTGAQLAITLYDSNSFCAL